MTMSLSSPPTHSTESLPDASGADSVEAGSERLDGRARFRQDVKAWLKRTGHGQNELAARAGIDKSQLSRALTGSGGVSPALMEKIGTAMGVDATTAGRWLGFGRSQIGPSMTSRRMA